MLPLPQTLPQITPPECPDSDNHPMPSIAPHQPPNNVLVDQLPAPIVNTRPTRIRNPSVKLKDSYTYSVEPTISKQVVAPPVEYIQLFEPVENSCFFGIIEDPSEPLTFAEANAHPGWRAAMKSERDSLMKNHTWELCEPPPGIKPVTAKWIYKTKIGANGQPSKLKARLVARGF